MTKNLKPPGIYEDMPDAEYRAIDATSKSDLDAWIEPDRKMPIRALQLGTCFHLLARDPALTKGEFGTVPEDYDLRTKGGKAAMAKWEADNPGVIGIRPKEKSLLAAMRASMMAHPDASKAVKADIRWEISIVDYMLPDSAVICKARLDMVGKAICDIKTTNLRSEDEFVNAICAYNYHAQAAWYTDLWAARTGDHLPFWFLVVSKQPPHNVWLTQITPQQLAFGRHRNHEIVRLYERYGGVTNEIKESIKETADAEK